MFPKEDIHHFKILTFGIKMKYIQVALLTEFTLQGDMVNNTNPDFGKMPVTSMINIYSVFGHLYYSGKKNKKTEQIMPYCSPNRYFGQMRK